MGFKLSFRHVFIILSLVLLSACDLRQQNDGGDLIVSVYDKDLSENDLKALLPENGTLQDSIELCDRYIQEWVTKELLLEKARLNIGNSPDIAKMVQEYENSLLVSRYLERMVEEKADNEPLEEEIQTYYETYKDNFILQENIVKGFFLKLRNDAPRVKDVRAWMKSDTEEDWLLLDDYCFQNATNFEKFGDQWISLNAIEKYSAETFNVKSRLFRKGNVIEQSDSLYLYFLKLENVKLINDTAPLEFVSPRIDKILRHQKKLDYLSSLKKSIYNDAIKNNIVVFYDENE